MSDWLHCNVCFRLPNGKAEIPFFFASCGHILCGNCNNTEPTGKCRVCDHSIRVLQINRNMRADMQIYFRDPKDLIERYVKNVVAVVDFQNGHRARLNKARLDEGRKMAKLIECARAELNNKADETIKIATQMGVLREEADKLRRHCKKLESVINDYEMRGRQRIRTSGSSTRSRSSGSGGSNDRHSRSLLDFSFRSSNNSNSGHRPMPSKAERNAGSVEHGSNSLVNESTEPSSVMTGSILTTPYILGMKNSTRPPRVHHRSASGGFPGQSFIF